MASNDYLSLITGEHRGKPKFAAWLSTVLLMMDEIRQLALQLDFYFDIDSAAGIQLDMLGQTIGQTRAVDFQPTDGSIAVLTDGDYRVLLKAKIIKNLWKGDISVLPLLWENLFPDAALVIADNQDMTWNVFISGNLPLTQRDLVRNGYIVPKPQGVKVNYYFGVAPFFGFDLNNRYISGFDTARWVHSKEVHIFAFDHNDAQFVGFDKGYWNN